MTLTARIIALATAMGSSVKNLTIALANRVRFDADQSLTAVQIKQAGNNLGIGDPDTDFAAVFKTALV